MFNVPEKFLLELELFKMFYLISDEMDDRAVNTNQADRRWQA